MATITANIVGPSAPAWTANQAVTAGTRRTNSSSPVRWYECITTGTCAASGGPTTTAADITDNTAHWKYLCDVDYTSDSAWEAGLPASAVTAGNSYVGQRWKRSNLTSDTQDWTFTAANFTLAGTTTDSTHTIAWTAAAGEGLPDGGSALADTRYDANEGVGLRITSGSYFDFVTITDNFVSIARLQLKNSSSGNSLNQVSATGTNLTVDQCVFDGNLCTAVNFGSPLVILSASSGSKVTNSLFVNRSGCSTIGGSASITLTTSSAVAFANNTFVCPSDATNVNKGAGIQSSYCPTNAKNCAFFGLGYAVNIDHATATLTNCATDKANFGNTGTGGVITPSSSLTSKTYANQFINTAGASGDWNLKAGADCLDAGTTDTTDIPAAIDMVGTARPQGGAWDIGCRELVSAVSYLPYNPWPQSAPILAQ